MNNIYLLFVAVLVTARLLVSTGTESAPRQADLPPGAKFDSPTKIDRDASDTALSKLNPLATRKTPVAAGMNRPSHLKAVLVPAS